MKTEETPILQQCSREEKLPGDPEHTAHLTMYPIEMSAFLDLPDCVVDPAGVPCYRQSEGYEGYYPITIVQHALAHWNQYIATGNEKSCGKFLAQAKWLVKKAVSIGDTAIGWPITFSHSTGQTQGPWLSALAQGCGISVLARAYQLTQEQTFLEAAHLAVRIFERDILDGGVQSPIGDDGVFFEEVAIYPASHQLSGFIFALLGLYDYVSLTKEDRIEQLIERSLITLHCLLNEFDLGYWTRSDLLQRDPASPMHLRLQVALLSALARYTGCNHCSALASRWGNYPRQGISLLRYKITRSVNLAHVPWKRFQDAFFPKQQNTQAIRVCIPITGFPVTGGTRTVLNGVTQVTQGLWQTEYLTQYVGPNPEGLVIHRFGTRRMEPWQFPFVWLYFLAGCWWLLTLLHQGAEYQVICPQDGVFTAAFAALAAKLAGVRVVCMDHGNLTLLKSQAYRVERMQALAMKNWSPLRRFLARLRNACYWPSLCLLAHISARCVDHFLIPGVVGDGVEEICQSLGVPASRITRFASTIDVDHYGSRDSVMRADMRQKSGIAVNAIVIAMVCRLAPEKGLDTALEGIHRALAEISPDLRERVRVVIAGDGPLRSHIEEEIHMRGLDQTVMLLGEISTNDVVSLLGISDIFLYTSTRGACLSMAILEAMASACAVVASPLPMANVSMLAHGRGMIVPVGDAEQTASALVQLASDMELCQRMGQLARAYVKLYHSPVVFKRTLLRTTSWSGLAAFLPIRTEMHNQ